MNRVGIPAKNVSIYVRDANTNEVVLEVNDNLPRSPASVIKVLTTYVALDSLGPSYTWKTRAYINGSMANGVLNGDLFVVGGGDPYMTSERWWRFVQSLREARAGQDHRRLRHRPQLLRACRRQPRRVRRSQPFRSYNVLPDALMVNFQTSRFTLIANEQRGRPHDPGQSAALQPRSAKPGTADRRQVLHLRRHVQHARSHRQAKHRGRRRSAAFVLRQLTRSAAPS